MQPTALRANMKAQDDPENLDDMSEDNWMNFSLMAPQIIVKQTQAFDQAPMVKMETPQLIKTLAHAHSL